MSIFFRGQEILEMARQIERNGARFYRHAAQGINEAGVRDLLLSLADMEDEHERLFAAMKGSLLAEAEGTPSDEVLGEEAQYLRAWADGHVFDVHSDPLEALTGLETIGDILKIAMGMEKESIVFYLGFKDAVPSQVDRNQVDTIIKEEMKHLASLGTRLKAVRNELV